VVASALRRAGFFMGGDLNGADDNLWFTLLFKHPDLPEWPAGRVDERLTLFLARMEGLVLIDAEVEDLIVSTASDERPQHTTGFLRERAATFLSGIGKARDRRWGWKEPNTHLVADRLLRLREDALYVHVNRHGIDMAYSSNQTQAENWSRWLVGTAWDGSPRRSLSYWRVVTERAESLAAAWPGRVLIVDFDQWCEEPALSAGRLAEFAGIKADPVWINGEVAAVARRPEPRWPAADLDEFDASDLAFVQSRGYTVGTE